MPSLRRNTCRAAVAGIAALGVLASAGTAAIAAPARSHMNAMVNFSNVTGLTLSRGWHDAPAHGQWTTFPPETMVPMKKFYWQTDSDGFDTGTEGSVVYKSSAGDVRVHWDVPAHGANSADCAAPQGYICQSSYPGHDFHVVFQFTLTPNVQF